MILGKVHAASDLFSPLFGHTFGFKDNAYNTLQPPTEKDAKRFGEKHFLIYTSWLLNRRFGARKRKGQVHFGHSLLRTVTREALTSFPRPALRSAAQRFRGETGFQLYAWFTVSTTRSSDIVRLCYGATSCFDPTKTTTGTSHGTSARP